jgi:uncharacterized membrane protein YdfJ with MMPL/SSD domain/pSer/pThr/pTyr-binding forkhead associated (FHA) protein
MTPTVVRHELEVLEGGDSGRRIALDGDLLLGRTVEGPGRFGDDLDVSRRHARILCHLDGAVVIEDLGSANGTWVNGSRIDGQQLLRGGDRIGIGRTTLRLNELPVSAAGGATRVAGLPTAVGAATAAGDQLKVIAGRAVGRRLRPDPELVLGRAVEGDGMLGDDPEASRRHARIWRDDEGGLMVEDLGSANATWVNGEALEEPQSLVPGDNVRVGQTILLVTDSAGGVPAPTKPSERPPEAPAPEPEPEPPGEQLEIADGPGAGRRIAVEQRLVLGRSVAGEGQLPEDPEVSRRHARVQRGPDGGLTVEDLDSGNGTWLNGTRLDAPHPLAPGDRLRLGATTFVVTDAWGRVVESEVRERPRPRRRGPLPFIAELVARRCRIVLLLVAVFVVAAGALGGNVATVLSQGNDFNDPQAPSVLAEERLAEAAGAQPGAGVIALVSAAEGRIADPDLDARARRSAARARTAEREAREARRDAQTPEDQLRAQQLAQEAQEASDRAEAADRRARRARSSEAEDTVERVERIFERDPGIDRAVTYYETGGPAFLSDDRRETYVAGFLKPDVDQDALSDRLEERLRGMRGVVLGGSALAGPAVGEQAEHDLRAAEMIALPLLLLASLFVFRGLVAALLPVFVGVVTVVGTFLGLRIANEISLQSIFALNMVVGLGLGLAIDYSLFIVSRYREEMARTGPGAEALRRTLETAGRTVMFSSATVSAALSSLLVFPQRFLYSMGIGGMICTAVASAAALIALPALLALLGPRVNALAPRSWQRAAERAARGEEAGPWYRLSHFVMRRPVPVALACSAFLIVAGLPFLDVKFTGVDASVLPASSPIHRVDVALARDFSENPGSPISLAVEAPRTARSELDEYVADLEKLPDVAAVGEPNRLNDELWQIDVTPEHGPFDDRTQALVDRIRVGDAPFPVEPAGEAAAFVDQQASLAERLPIALAGLIVSTLVILFVLTGSVVLPLKSVLMNFLGLSATFGLLVLIFQEGHLEGPLAFESEGALNATQPILLFIVAFGLSTDYGVFLLTRIKEQFDAGVPNREAVATGLQRTGRIVTAAAVLFSIALGAFASSEIVFIKLVGVGAVLAVLIDSSIIRALLVPALMALLGTRNWWAPRPLRRLHEKVGLSES